MKIYSRFLLRAVWILILITSCVEMRSINSTPVATTAFTNTPTPSPTKTIYSTRTPKPTQPFTPTPDFGSLTFQPRNANEVQTFVMFQLNQGKEISEIDELFNTDDGRQAWVDGRKLDFDGDKEEEIFLIASVYIEGAGNIENIYWIVKKIQGQYEIAYTKSEIADYGAGIEINADINGDSLQDLIFARPLFGNGAGAVIFVAYFRESKFSIQKVAETDLIISEIKISPHDTNSINNLIVTGFESGWGSSGPGRTIEETYSVNDKSYVLLQSRYLPDKYRIHVLQDAQIAYNTGDEKLAVKLWEQAAYDESLENFPSMWIENDLPEKYQPAFAIYRLYTYYLSINDAINTQKYWLELNNKYLPNSPGGEFIELGSEAKRLLGLSQDPTFVCNGIYEFLNSTNERAGFLIEHWYWGDHNLDIVDFCPLRQ